MNLVAYTKNGFKIISVETEPDASVCIVTDKYNNKTYEVLDWFVLVETCYTTNTKGKLLSVGLKGTNDDRCK